MKDNSKIIDCYIGQKIRDRRTKLHLSQAELAEMLGVSAQHVQRHESGENGVALGKLPLFATTLNVKTNYFT
jgi:transcriptional regulator with XRE-family HTH domain